MNENNDRPLDEELAEADRQIRMEKLKERLHKLSDGKAVFGEIADTPSELTLEFLEHVLRFEESAQTTHAKLLLEDGVTLPPPDSLTDDEVHAVLWNVIHGLHAQRTFLYHTDHLSDRELYVLLWGKLLNYATVDLRGDPDAGCHLDVVGSGSEEHTALWLRYFADEEDRRWWREEYPDASLPPPENPPYDRDRHLPKREGF